MRLLKTTAFTQTTEEYASRSSIHGIGYIFDRELGIFDRVLWLLVVFVFLGVAGALTLNLWTQWRDEQVINTPFCCRTDSHDAVIKTEESLNIE